MIHNLYAVKDTLVGFSQPFPMSNDQVAIRSFTNAAQSLEKNSVNTDSQHKQLWYIGTFDDVTASLEASPRFIVDASQCMFTVQEKKDAGDS